MENQIIKKSVIQNTPKIIRTKGAHIDGIEDNIRGESINRTCTIGRCAKCQREKDHKTRNFCDEFNFWVCPLHFSKICNVCEIKLKRKHEVDIF